MKFFIRQMVAILLICSFFTPQALAQDSGLEIAAEGYGVIHDDVANALDVAIRDAMRRGIEQALGSYIDSHTLVGNFGLVEDSILAKSAGYVSSYAIEEQIVADGLVTVVLVMVVQQGQLKDDLDALALALARKGNPRVLVIIPEESRGWLKANSSAEKAVAESLIKHGFLVVTDNPLVSALDQRQIRDAALGDHGAQRELGRLFDADLLIVGTASSSQVANLHGLLSYRGKVSLQGVDLATGKVLTSFEIEDLGLDISPERAIDKALTTSGEQAAERLIGALASRFVAQSTALSLEISGISFTDLAEIETRLKRTRLTETVTIREFAGNWAKIEVTTGLTAMQLAREIGGPIWLSLPLEVVNVVGSKLVLQKR